MTTKRLKIAFMGYPKISGNYTHFQYLANGLPEFDWTILQVGNIDVDVLPDPHFINLGKDIDRKTHPKELASMLLKFLTDHKFDVLIPMNSPIAVSVIPYLPQEVKVINIVNSNTPRVYKYVTEHSDYVSKIVCISQVQFEIIKNVKSVFSKNIIIPHGQKIEENFVKEKNAVFKIGFLGRILDAQKGCFLIPYILENIEIPYILEIVGDGTDKNKLLKLLEEKKINFVYKGFLIGEEKIQVISSWDVLLFPSKIEGFGLTLIECMQFGVIPIAHTIKGVTDTIIHHQQDGFLMADHTSNPYREKIKFLFDNPKEKTKISEAARNKVKEKFDLEKILTSYKSTFLESQAYEKPEVLEFKNWNPYKEYKPSLLTRVINKIKKIKIFFAL